MNKFDVSLVLACYNEAEIFDDSIKRIINTLDQTDSTYEIIFVDDASEDNTVKLIKQAIKNYPRHHLKAFFHQKNQGRGQTVIDGFKKAQGKKLGFIDIDLEVGEWYLPYFISSLDKNTDVVIANRVYDLKLWTIHRWLGSKGYTLLRKIFLGLPFKDTEAGYKFFKRNKLLPLLKKAKAKDWFFDTEIMVLCHKNNLKVKQLPVAFVRRSDKTSTVKLLPDTINYFINLIKYSFSK